MLSSSISPSQSVPSMSPISALSSIGSSVLVGRVSAGSLPTQSPGLAFPPLSRCSSGSSLRLAEGVGDVVSHEGIPHFDIALHARYYRSRAFAADLLVLVNALQTHGWVDECIDASFISVRKVTNSLTNAVFFVSCPQIPRIPTILLRIYGTSTGELISRTRELHTLHVLSSQYHIGPRLYGTFANGRIEEYLESVTLTPSDIRKPHISRWIGARMAELHSVDLDLFKEPCYGGADEWQIGATANVIAWLNLAREVLSHPAVPDTLRTELNLDQFSQDWERYAVWVFETELRKGSSKRVLSHNDAQYGNLLKLSNLQPGAPEHRQIVVVDFEYASPNPSVFDIANHFIEWTTDYNSDTPFLLNSSRYPTLKERRNFYVAYFENLPFSPFVPSLPGPFSSLSKEDREGQIQKLEELVRIWSPSSHAMWAVWAIVQAREDLENGIEPDFDYIGYSKSRMEGFYREIRALDV